MPSAGAMESPGANSGPVVKSVRGWPILAVFVMAFVVSCAAADVVVGPPPRMVEGTFMPDPAGYRLEPWIGGLDVPWSLVFLPDGRALVTERVGRIRLIRDGRLRDEPYASLQAAAGDAADLTDAVTAVVTGGEGGLMGLAVHPRFPEQPYVYVMQTYRMPNGMDANRVIRLRDEDERAAFDRTIVDRIPASTFHDGGRIAFGPDGMLYVTTGDASSPQLAQVLDSLAGKILRLTPEGGIPADNPVPGSPVYSYGHRNPQGLAWHPVTGDLFASEHGPSGEFGLGAHDEINVIRAGGNYGWPRVVGAPGRSSYVDPIVEWPEASFPPGGIAFFDGALFVATMKSEVLARLALSRTDGVYGVERMSYLFAEERGRGQLGRLRDAVAGPDGALYVLTSNRDGRGDPRPGDDRIYRLVRAD